MGDEHERDPELRLQRLELDLKGLALSYEGPEITIAGALLKNDSGELDWAVRLPTRYLLGGRLCWQPIRHLARDAALTVVTAENKLVCNLFEQFGARECPPSAAAIGGVC